MRYEPFKPYFFIKNRKSLEKKLQKNSLVVLSGNELIPQSADQFFPFRQNSDFYYLTGIDEENALLCLCPQHPDPKLREVLFIQETNTTRVIWSGKRLNKDESSKISGIKTVKWTSEFNSILRNLALNSEIIYLELNEYTNFSSKFTDVNQRLVNKIKSEYPLHKYERLTPLTTELRLCKSKEEIKMIKKAIDITKEAFLAVLKMTKVGIMEYEIEAEITHNFIKRGASGHAFNPIVASGVNACILHYITNDCKIKNGDMILIDFGAVYGNYTSDCSRTFPANGKFSSRQKQCYNAVLDVLKECRKFFVPGTTIEEINKKVAALLENKMLELGLFSKTDLKNNPSENPLYFKYYMHGASHFMGIDVHDVGSKTTVLKKGMVLTCEPGLYIKEENIGIRIENNILVDEKPIDLTTDIPFETEEIEFLMKK